MALNLPVWDLSNHKLFYNKGINKILLSSFLASDLSQCSTCNFPGQRSELMTTAKAGESCPMCGNGLLNDFPALNPSQIKVLTYATTKELEDENVSLTNGNHEMMNGNEEDEDSEENNNPNSSSSNATAGESRPGSYK